MAIKQWPAEICPATIDFGVKYDVQITVSRSGSISTFSLPGARWVTTLTMPNDLEARHRPKLEALIVGLEGGANRLSAPHFGRRIPNGSLRGAPTLAATALANQSTLSLQNCNGGLNAGDLIGLPGQVVMIMDTVVPSSGNMTVNVKPRLRAQHAPGTPVTWSSPNILWVPKTSAEIMFPYVPGRIRPGFSIDLVEAYT